MLNFDFITQLEILFLTLIKFAVTILASIICAIATIIDIITCTIIFISKQIVKLTKRTLGAIAVGITNFLNHITRNA